LEPLASINTTFERLEHGKVAGRVVLDFTKVGDVRPKAVAKQVPVPA